MEVPPGRVERIADGGPEAIRSILAELRAMKFNGVLKTSVFRGDTPSQGVLVLRRGDGVLAEHRSAVDVAGHEALPEILKDAASARAQLEVRTYDYGHSSISIDHLQRSYPEAAVEGIGDPDRARPSDRARGSRARGVRDGTRCPSGPGADARRAGRGTLPPEVGTRAGVPAERDATARTRLPSGRTPDGQGGERPDPQSTRGTPDLPGRRGRVPEEGPRDGGREGPIGA